MVNICEIIGIFVGFGSGTGFWRCGALGDDGSGDVGGEIVKIKLENTNCP